MTALGFATTDQTAPAQQAETEEQRKQAQAQEQALREKQEAERIALEADEAQARVDAEAKRLAALEAITDGAVIFCDGCENTVVRVVNSYGRQQKFDNGGYRAGLKCGAFEAVYYNTQCPDQFAAECWSVLKAVEFAAERGLKSCTVRNDRIGGFEACNEKKQRRGYVGAKYLSVAQKIAREHGLAVTFDPCSCEDNQADAVVRRPGKVR